MTKFALFLMICSSVQGVCTNPHSDYKKYDDFHSCIKSGTTKVVDIVNEFDKKEFNEDKIVIRYYCEEINEDTADKASIQNFYIPKKI